jgi:hypothetical protein
MELIVSSFVLVVIFFILSISLSGKGQRIAKEVLKELINGPEGKMLVGFWICSSYRSNFCPLAFIELSIPVTQADTRCKKITG